MKRKLEETQSNGVAGNAKRIHPDCNGGSDVEMMEVRLLVPTTQMSSLMKMFGKYKVGDDNKVI